MKRIILKILKWFFLISFFGSGWIALIIFFIIQAMDLGGTRLGLPLVDSEPKKFWDIGYQGEVPKKLIEKGNLVVFSSYGFTDVMKIGLVRLDDLDRKDIIGDLFNETKVKTEESLWTANVLCIGSADLALSWQIQKKYLREYFNFCNIISKPDVKEVMEIKLEEKVDDKIGFSYMHIEYIVGTNYFIVSHGKP